VRLPTICIVCSILVWSVVFICKADVLPTPVTPTDSEINVTGHAEIDMKPDVAYATLGVVTQAAAEPDAVSQNATKATAVKAALIKGGVAEDDVDTQYYQVSPQYDYRSTPAVLVGYQVTNEFKVTIHNLPKAGVIVDRASQAGANQVDGISYDLADKTGANNQALAAAVANARSKADLMAGAAGVSLGRLIELSEGTESSPRPVYPMMMRAAAAQSQQATTPLTPQDIVVTADVTAQYAIGYSK
jgi:uncharacterized protein YggE